MSNEEIIIAVIKAIWSESYTEKEKAEQLLLEIAKRLKVASK